ncbi:MAG: hypothetical protein IH905_09330 [Proteobacteria bacterium]|nr:hypothetical protein [Pseudomonadota bacterium]
MDKTTNSERISRPTLQDSALTPWFQQPLPQAVLIVPGVRQFLSIYEFSEIPIAEKYPRIDDNNNSNGGRYKWPIRWAAIGTGEIFMAEMTNGGCGCAPW